MTARQRTALLCVLLVGLSFGVGSGWQFTRAYAARQETAAVRDQLATAQRELAIQRLEGALAAATIAAQLGSYERGRQFASDFFTGLQAALDSAAATARPVLQELLAHRDQTITALSRAEPGIAFELARMFVRYRGATGGDPGIIEIGSRPDTSRRPD
jgi:hypothetical protein